MTVVRCYSGGMLNKEPATKKMRKPPAHIRKYDLLLRQYKGLLVKNVVLQGLNNELVDKLTQHGLKDVLR